MKNIIIKISGEYLELFNQEKIKNIINEIKQLIQHQYKISIVIGGGNIIRSKNLQSDLIKPHEIDICGMQATHLNGLILHYAFKNSNIQSQVINTFQYTDQDNYINIFTQGINVPYFSTDIALMIRGYIINADILIKATNVDGVYTSDPIKNKDVKKFDSLSFDQYLDNNLQCIDTEAVRFAQKHNLKIQITHISDLANNIINQKGTFLFNK